MKKLYGGVDLHSNNSVVVVLDEADQVQYQKRVPNDLTTMLQQLAPFQVELQGLVVESTYNWYWLVDGLQEAGYIVHLAKGLSCMDAPENARVLGRQERMRFAVMYPAC